MSSWDNPRDDYGYVFEGSFDNNYPTGSGRNPVFGYTFSPADSWLSVRSPNLNQLAFETEAKGKQKQQLMVMMKGQGGLAREFEVFLGNPKHSTTLRIYVYSMPGKSVAEKTVVIHGVKVSNVGPPRLSISLPMSKRKLDLPIASREFALVYTLSYDTLQVV